MPVRLVSLIQHATREEGERRREREIKYRKKHDYSHTVVEVTAALLTSSSFRLASGLGSILDEAEDAEAGGGVGSAVAVDVVVAALAIAGITLSGLSDSLTSGDSQRS